MVEEYREEKIGERSKIDHSLGKRLEACNDLSVSLDMGPFRSCLVQTARR